ncbi:MAG: 2-amino-4-hydroxy-6-hydroxymethyldihydropteridine diphosphokinase [Bacteroidales bacterium]|nr:2-amino-4-hydroxy-6-hydroxymethyldihydropteridine diphosphokinase [Bacteroidales bacterium]
MNFVFLQLGSNIGDRVLMFDKAKNLIKQKIGAIIKQSSIYETQPWGFNTDDLFLNQVLLVETKIQPDELLEIILNIEVALGRVRKSDKYESRLIDIDILFYDNLIINNEKLIIPHPLIQDRLFVLEPLNEIASDFVHPVLKKTINELLLKCDDKLKIKKY